MIRTAFALAVFSIAALAAEAPLIALVDPSAKAIAGVHVDRTLSSDLGRYLLSQMNEDDAGFSKFVEATGFDPRLHVREVVVGSADTTRKNGFVAARGVFDGPRILAAAQKHGAATLSYNGVPIVNSKQGQWLAILDGSLALMGDQALVKYAIDNRSATQIPASSLARKASALAGQHDAWAVASGVMTAPKSNPVGKLPPMGAALSAILETSGGINFGSMVRVSGEAVTRSDKDAQALVDVIRFVATMMRNNVQSDANIQRLEPVLNSLEVRAPASTVTISFSVPEADLEQLLTPKRTSKQAALR